MPFKWKIPLYLQSSSYMTNLQIVMKRIYTSGKFLSFKNKAREDEEYAGVIKGKTTQMSKEPF